MTLKKNSEKVKDLLGYFKALSDVDKLRLAINILEDNWLKLNIDKNKEIGLLEERLIELDSSYKTTIVNFSQYQYLTLLSAKVTELSAKEQNDCITEMLENIYAASIIST